MAVLIELRGVSKRHQERGLRGRGLGGTLAVDRVSFAIRRGSVFGLVGESGCGKTTLARAVLHLDPPTSGEVLYAGEPLGGLSRGELRGRRRRMQIVFQDPNSALNPRMRIGASVEEGLRNLRLPAADRQRRAREMLELVGIPPEHAVRYPHEFSGGQKQRIVIARALTMDPEFLVLDEPVSNLDVSIQAQIVNLLLDLREKLSLTYLFISHDLHLVAYLADEIGVMYRGRLVETGPAERIMAGPAHPYTRRLFASAPGSLTKPAAVREAPEEPFSPGGCPYRGLCPDAEPRCAAEEPALRELGGGRSAACHRAAPDGGLHGKNTV